MSGSLVWRVAASTAIATVVCMAVAGAVIDVAYGLRLRDDLVTALHTQRDYLVHPDDEHGILAFDPEADQHPEITLGTGPAFYQIWAADASIEVRSPSLRGRDLLAAAPRLINDQGVFTLPLPDGQPGLALASTLTVGTHRYVIAVAQGTATMDEARARLRLILLSVGLAVAALGSAAVALVARQAMRPLRELATAISERAERPAPPLDAGAVPRELRPLVTTLEAAITKLQDSVLREQQFTADAAHELRTPLAAQRLLLELHQPHEAVREPLALALQMQALVDSLLTLARLEAGSYPVVAEPCDVGALIAMIAESRGIHAEAVAGTTRQVTLPAASGPMMAGDPVLLRQVIANLVDNALEHGDRAGSLTIACAHTGDQLTLTIANTGCILTPDQVPLVFDRFWRGDGSRSATGRHAGLGLPLCRRLIEAMDGSISVTADSGWFTVTVVFRSARLPSHQPRS